MAFTGTCQLASGLALLWLAAGCTYTPVSLERPFHSSDADIDAKGTDADRGDARTGDSAPGDTQTGDGLPGDALGGDALPGDALGGDALPGDALGGDALPGDALEGDGLPGDAHFGDLLPGDGTFGDPNNGSPAIIVEGPWEPTVLSEAGGTAEIWISLGSSLVGQVALLVQTSDASELLLSDGTQPTEAVTLIFTENGGASPWNEPQKILAVAQDDWVADGPSRVTIAVGVDAALTTDSNYLSLSPVTLHATVEDDDHPGITVMETNGSTSIAEPSQTDTIALKLASQPNADVIVAVALDTADATISSPDADDSQVELTFTSSSWNIAQALTLIPVDDFVAEGTRRLTLSVAPDARTLDTTGYADLGVTTLLVTVVDDDLAELLLTETDASTVIEEPSTSDSINVRLGSEPNDSVVVVLDVSDAGQAYLSTGDPAQSIELTFGPAGSISPWNHEQIVTVLPRDDFIAEPTAQIDINAWVDPTRTADTTGYALLDNVSLAVIVADDDAPGITLVESNGETVISEPRTTDQFTVQLNSQPDGTVGVVVAGDPAQMTLGTNEGSLLLEFDATNWSTPREVVVAPVDDTVIEYVVTSEVTVTVDAAATFDTTGYETVPPISLWVRIEDDDAVPDVRLNEVSTSNGDWVELYNAGSAAQDLTGWMLTDDEPSSVSKQYVFSSGMILEAGQFLVIFRCPEGTPCFDYGFGKTGDQVRLYSSTDYTLPVVDTFAWSEDWNTGGTDFTMGRLPDGTGDWALTTKTPGSANLAP